MNVVGYILNKIQRINQVYLLGKELSPPRSHNSYQISTNNIRLSSMPFGAKGQLLY